MTEYKNRHLPHAIYLDTNILRSTGIDFNRSWISELIAFANRYNILICIPELVFDEVLKYISEQLKSNMQKVISASHFLLEYEAKLPNIDEQSIILPDLNELTTIVENKITVSGLQIIENFLGPLEQLIAEAIEKILPFEKEDKGFCDAIILESCISHALKNYPNPRIVILSNDDAVIRSGFRFSRKGITAIFSKGEEIVEKLKSFLDKEVAEFLEEREKNLLKFIKTKEKEILDFVAKSPLRFSDFLLNSTFIQGEKIEGIIQSILSAKPIEIIKVVESFPISGEEKPANRLPIDIWVDIQLEVMVQESIFANPFLRLAEPRGIAEPSKIDEASPLILKTYSYTLPREIRKTIRRIVYIKASLDSKEVEKGEYKDLKLEKIQ